MLTSLVFTESRVRFATVATDIKIKKENKKINQTIDIVHFTLKY
jgi:hypothetical protein